MRANGHDSVDSAHWDSVCKALYKPFQKGANCLPQIATVQRYITAFSSSDPMPERGNACTRPSWNKH